ALFRSRGIFGNDDARAVAGKTLGGRDAVIVTALYGLQSDMRRVDEDQFITAGCQILVEFRIARNGLDTYRPFQFLAEHFKQGLVTFAGGAGILVGNTLIDGKYGRRLFLRMSGEGEGRERQEGEKRSGNHCSVPVIG